MTRRVRVDLGDSFTTDDKLTEMQRLERERQLREQGLNPHELGSDEAKDLSDDMRGDQINRAMHSNDLGTSSSEE